MEYAFLRYALMIFGFKQSHKQNSFSLPPASSSIFYRVLASVCLSQRAWEQAGEEGLACANYILIIGDVMANQTSFAILEQIAPLCRCWIETWGMHI